MPEDINIVIIKDHYFDVKLFNFMYQYTYVYYVHTLVMHRQTCFNVKHACINAGPATETFS